MGIVSSGALCDALRRRRLVSASSFSEILHLAQGRSQDARGLAKLLVQRGWLTLFQMREILRGGVDNLVIGPYHVLDLLGKGGLSQVFKARHAEQGWIAALKVLRPEALCDAPGRRQFLEEMEAMAQMSHPNVVEFCDVDQADETFYFAMEFVEGVDLGKRVALAGPLPPHEACDYIRQAALGLQHAHERNIVHRDIKPMNLFLTQAPVLEAGNLRGQAAPLRSLIKIIDWGLALRRLPGAALDEHEDSRPSMVGTADYLAPEQAQDSWSVDIRADIYGLGCTFYYLLTGQPPFPQRHLGQKLMMHRKERPRPLSEFRRDVPGEVDDILKRMMAKTPAQRFQTPAAVALALVPFAVARSTVMPTGAPPQVVAGRSSSPRKDETPLPGALSSSCRQALARATNRNPRAPGC
ncbi:MAG: serine/threonine-protein kinase [Gemmataceae bacterium]